MFFTSIAARTDLGLVRQGNEDSALYHSTLIAVADGMGGAVGGEIASRIAIKTLAAFAPMISNLRDDLDSQSEILQRALSSIDEEIASEISSRDELAGMGTTLTALAASDKTVALLHIGDSRAYRLREGKLTRLSHDHTVIQELLDQGRITEAEVADHPQRSVLTLALMGRGLSEITGVEDSSPAIHIYPAQHGDIYLLSSDGLNAILSEEEIAKIINSSPLDQAANNLIAATRNGGAPDNVTVILAEFAPLKKSDKAVLDHPISFLGAAHE
jgi:serine/threonine protein phosphatase PrpC